MHKPIRKLVNLIIIAGMFSGSIANTVASEKNVSTDSNSTVQDKRKFITKKYYKLDIYRKATDSKIVAITFDDGPDPRYTPKILDTLEKYDAKATFFIVGESALKNKEIVNRAIADGDEIENHTYTHPEMANLTDKQMLDEIDKNQRALEKNFSIEPIYFRPPKGVCTESLVRTLMKRNMRTVLWSMCFEHKAEPDPEQRAKTLISKIKPGNIILAHDGRLNRTKTVKGMTYLIKGLKEKGYKFVTLKELLNSKRKKVAKSKETV